MATATCASFGASSLHSARESAGRAHATPFEALKWTQFCCPEDATVAYIASGQQAPDTTVALKPLSTLFRTHAV